MTNNVKCIADLNVSFELDGKTYKFNTSDMSRNLSDGTGNPIYSAQATDQYGRHAALDLGTDWTVRHLFIDNSFTLRNKIADAKEEYAKHGKSDGWHWKDEGLPYAIMDYESSVGLADFTEDDWKVCEENGWTRAEVEELCKED